MYFPYLRGKQFELLALRELSPELRQSAKVLPIIEPVKKAAVGLEKAFEAMIANNVNFTIVINPAVGEFSGNFEPLISKISSTLSQYDNFQFGILINQSTNLDDIDFLLSQMQFERDLALIHLARPNDLDALLTWGENKSVKYNLYKEQIPIRRYRGLITPETKVILEDKFNSRNKNADYLTNQDEFFSEEHLFFAEDGNIGFSDYLTIGQEYTDTGFLPYAVAIHITYINTDDKIWVRHFVSDSNLSNLDVAGKFGEALNKLVDFLNEKNIHTGAAEEFRAYHASSHYPGLGTIKKLSIKHHLELMMSVL